MTETKQTLKTPSGAQNILDNLTDKDKKISELETKLKDLEEIIDDLDYLLNWGRNKFEHERNKRLEDLEQKLNQPLTNQELLKELARRIVLGQLKLAKPWDLTEEGKTPEEIVAHLKNRMGLYNKDGYAWCNIREIYDRENNDNPLNLNYFIAEVKHELQEQKDKQEPIILLEESEKDNSPKLTKIQGILTSSIRPKPSSDTPFYGYLRPDNANNKHSQKECESTKCQECEIPVVFRWISKNHRMHEMEPKEPCFNEKEHWRKPNLKKGDRVMLEGEFEQSKKSNRPSFTAYGYQIINDHGNN